MISETCTAAHAHKYCCRIDNKCGLNEGHCETSNDCKNGLMCGENNCPIEFPDWSYNCCYKPAFGKLLTFLPLTAI